MVLEYSKGKFIFTLLLTIVASLLFVAPAKAEVVATIPGKNVVPEYKSIAGDMWGVGLDGVGLAVDKDGVMWAYGTRDGFKVDPYLRKFLNSDSGEMAYSLEHPLRLADGIVSVAGSSAYFSYLKDDGTLWEWGYIGNKAYDKPVKIMDNVKRLLSFGYVIKKDDSLWVWDPSLSENSTINGLSPRKIMDSVASYTSPDDYIVDKNGGLWEWKYEVGSYSTVHVREKPIKIMNGVKQYVGSQYGFSGERHYVLKTDGTVWAWGSNSDGLGVDMGMISISRDHPVKVIEGVSKIDLDMALKKDGSLWVWNYGNPYSKRTALPVKMLENVKDIYSFYALSNDGELWEIAEDAANGYRKFPVHLNGSVNDYVGIFYGSELLGVRQDGSLVYTSYGNDSSRDFYLGVKHTVSFFETGFGSPTTITKVRDGEILNKPADPYVDKGVAFKGWYLDADLTKPYDFSKPVKTDLNLYAKFEAVLEQHTVSFRVNGGSEVDSQKVVEGKSAIKPVDPQRKGYTFAGWFLDTALTKLYDFKSVVTTDITLYAKWERLPATFTVKFESNGGSAVAAQKVTEGKAAAKPVDPTRSGYSFAGWYSDVKLTKAYDFKVAVKTDTTLYAKWSKSSTPAPTPQPKAYTVLFDSNGGSAVASQKVAEGKAAARPADPKRDGYTFKGWYSDARLTRAYDFKAAVKADATLYAKWEKASAPAPKPESRPSDQFTDVTGASTWVINQGYLDYAVSHNLMTGYKTDGKPNGLFGPTDTLTRGQVAVVLYRVATGRDSGDGSTGFKDAGAYPYYRTAIRWLKDQGLATGDRDPVTQAPLGTFRPDDPITRQELATLVYRFALKQGVKVGQVDASSLGKFSDDLQVMPYAREAVAWCNASGIITGGQGADAGKLMPLDNAQRAQAAKIFTVLHRDVLKLK